ncbi:MAG: TIGR00153 family protein [Myxococcales bacterium]|nr:TIGR00153 family protein [Myxococcales bacterium]
MRIPLGRLFGRNPFDSVNEMMDAVRDCVSDVPALIDALIADDQARIVALAKEISRKEAITDAVKNKLRDGLPGTLFLPVDRRDLLQLIGQMDAVADCAEDVGVLLTLRHFEVPAEMVDLLRRFVEAVMATVAAAGEVVSQVDVLLASGFAGSAAERTLQLIRDLGRLEHEADKLQDQIAKVLFRHEDRLTPVAIFMWTKVLNKIGDIANHAENVGDRVRLFLAR